MMKMLNEKVFFLNMKYSASKKLLWWQHWLSGHPFVGRGTKLVVESCGR